MTDHRDRVIEAARRLVWKIKADELRGTPIHPVGVPDCTWTLDDGGYPTEYAALAHALDEYDRHADDESTGGSTT